VHDIGILLVAATSWTQPSRDVRSASARICSGERRPAAIILFIFSRLFQQNIHLSLQNLHHHRRVIRYLGPTAMRYGGCSAGTPATVVSIGGVGLFVFFSSKK
jgi:hypothetical protein